jgi:hypothetical protein
MIFRTPPDPALRWEYFASPKIISSRPASFRQGRHLMLNGSPYLRYGAPQRCALCNASFMIEDEHIKCWKGKDHRYYCCPEHADFGLDKLLATSEPLERKVS